MDSLSLLISIIFLCLVFDFINGFHDAANSIATIVSTKVLTPFQAVLWAAFFNFVAFFIAKHVIGEFGIANTVSKTVYSQFITLPIILSGVIAAIIWNLFTWWKGIPSSSSHTLIGGFAGAAVAAAGWGSIQAPVILKIAAFIFLAPIIGMVVAFGITLLVLYLCRRANPHRAEKWSVGFIGTVQYRPRPQRFAEGDGDYRGGLDCFEPFRMGNPKHQRFAGLGSFVLLHGDCSGNDVGRLEDCQDDGHAHYQGDAFGRGRGRDGGRADLVPYRIPEDSCEHHAYDYRGDYRGRGNQAFVGGPLGRDQELDDGLDSDHPGQRAFGCRGLWHCELVHVKFVSLCRFCGGCTIDDLKPLLRLKGKKWLQAGLIGEVSMPRGSISPVFIFCHFIDSVVRPLF